MTQIPDGRTVSLVDRIDPSEQIGAAADTLAQTLADGADRLDQLVARHLPTESRAADLGTLEERQMVAVMVAGVAALNRQPFQPEAVA